MGQERKHIDDLFKNELGSYAETPPPMAWDALEKRLDKVPPQPTGWLAGRTLYIVMMASLLLLSVSVARKMYLTSLDQTAPARESRNKQTNTPTADGNRPLSQSAPATPNTPDKNTDVTVLATSNQPRNNNSTGKLKPAAKMNQPARPFQITSNKKSSQGQKSNRTALASRVGTTASYAEATDNIADPLPQAGGYKLQDPGKTQAEQVKDDTRENKDEQKKDAGKKNDQPGKAKSTPKPAPPKPQKPSIVRLEAGIKAGFESGFVNGSANKLVVSPYIQYNVSRQFAIMVQPAIKTASVATSSVGNSRSYYKENADSSNPGPVKDPYPVFTPDGIPYYLYHYYYSQTHDSIIKSFTAGGSYTEYELPVLLKYRVTKGLSVYGGVNISYSQLMSVKEHTNTISNISRTDSSIVSVVQSGYNPPPAQPTSQVITYSGTEISNYKNPYPTPAGNTFRVGYMFGFGVEYRNRWLFDGLMQQTPMPANMQGGYNVNSALSATYFRFTLGYKLIR